MTLSPAVHTTTCRTPPWPRFLLTYSFLLQTHVLLWLSFTVHHTHAYLWFVPFVGLAVHLAHLSWYWSFFCFEYKWALHGWTVDQRVAALEEQWLFHLGFGAPLALLSASLPTFTGYAVIAFLFPLFVVLATVSEPRIHEPSRLLPRRLPLFHQAKLFSLWIVTCINRRAKGGPRLARRRPAPGAADSSRAPPGTGLTGVSAGTEVVAGARSTAGADMSTTPRRRGVPSSTSAR